MVRAKTGQAIPPDRRTPVALASLEAFRDEAGRRGALDEWRRAQAVLGYIAGRRVVDIAESLDARRTTVTNWLRWYTLHGLEGLRTAKPGKSEPRLSPEQREELAAIVEAGPLAAGLPSGLWTGKMVASVIEERFGVSFHPQSVPRLLHQLGFSVQRPRKRLARADKEAQATWVRERLPEIKKRPPNRGE